MNPHFPDTDNIPLEKLDAGPAVIAATTTRGQLSDNNGPYSGFSICDYTGDSNDHIDRCRNSLARWCHVAPGHIIAPHQVHSPRVAVIDQLTATPGDVDALVTAMPGVVIGVNTADCVPVLLNDPVAGIIAAAHAGWRGAIAGIIPATIAAMEALGAAPSRIHAAMGPCIGVECFEVGDEVAAQFPDECVDRSRGKKPHVDLPQYVYLQLTACGIQGGNISMPQACTRCNPRKYFSARALSIASGRNFTFIARLPLKSDSGAK